jgi:ureidoacrylate peracid hydrolase
LGIEEDVMHQKSIFPSVVERIEQRRGGIGVFDRLDSRRTAHIVVDLQNGFMAPGAIAEIAEAREIVPAVNRISSALRDAGGLVVYIQNTFDEEAIRTWSTYFNHFCSPERRERMIAAFTPGAEGHAVWPGLDVQPDDLKVWKRRFGAFAPGASDLHAILQERGIDTLIITGTLTNCCCESTARDAMQRDCRVIFVSDGNATLTDAEHNATLVNMFTLFADVMTTAEVVECAAARASRPTKAA